MSLDTGLRTFADVWERAESVAGWLTEAQGRALYETAGSVEPGHWIVEIGSHCGRSTLVLAAAKRIGVRVLAVDPFGETRWGGGREAFATFQATLGDAGMLDEVRIFRGVSADASGCWDGAPVGMLFVDGAHDRASVLADIDGWAPSLAPGATLLFHDAFSSPGVTVALFERYFGRPGVHFLGATGSLARLRKVPTTRAARLSSSWRMLTLLPWFARNIAIKIAIRRRWGRVQRALGHRGPGYPY
jgi:predicted O-methyltransferase YrrM